MSANRGSMHLNTSYFEDDGISPTTILVNNWKGQVDKIFLTLDKKMTKPGLPTPLLQPGAPARRGDTYGLPPPKGAIDDRDRGLKRGYMDGYNMSDSPRDLGREAGMGHNREHRDYMDREYSRYEPRPREFSPRPPSPKIPSLLDMARSMDEPSRRPVEPTSHSFGGMEGSQQTPEQMATAMQLLAATMQMSGANASGVQSMFHALLSQQKQKQADLRDQEEKKRQEVARKRRMEDERVQMVKKKLEEAHQQEVRKRAEENRRREELQREEMRRADEQRRREAERRREEERIREQRLMEERRLLEVARRREEERQREMDARRRVAEENRLREIQIAAKLAMEQQKHLEQKRQNEAIQQQKAQLALLAVTQQVQEQMMPKQVATPFFPNAADGRPGGSALDRINEKLKIDREKKDRIPAVDQRIANDPAWRGPLVLFSFLNRTNERKPLRGIIGAKLHTANSRSLSDYRSRGQFVYSQSKSAAPTASFLKIKVSQPGRLSAFEHQVANYNNRLADMVEECESLVTEGRLQGYIIRREADDVKDLSNTAADAKTALTSTAADSTQKGKPVSDIKALKKDAETYAKGMGNGTENPTRVKDLRENLNRSAKRRDRSLTPADKRQKSTTSSERASMDAKPRWDKSDESDDELLWDDDEVPVKLAVDHDDGKGAHEKEVVEDDDCVMVSPVEEVSKKDDAPAVSVEIDNDKAAQGDALCPDAENGKNDRGVKPNSLSKGSTIISLKAIKETSLVTNKTLGAASESAEPNGDGFVTLDETA